jgi:hypothetical protein
MVFLVKCIRFPFEVKKNGVGDAIAVYSQSLVRDLPHRGIGQTAETMSRYSLFISDANDGEMKFEKVVRPAGGRAAV